MAQVFRREGSPYYYARFQIDGRDHCISTKTRGRPQAIDFLKRKLAERKGVLTADDAFSDLLSALNRLPENIRDRKRMDLAAQLVRHQQKKVAVTDAWKTWLASSKRREPVARTVSGYAGQWKQFEAWISGRHQVEFIHEITNDMAAEYAKHLWSQGVASGTYNAHVMFLRSLFRAIRSEAGLQGNPWDDVTARRTEREGRRNIERHELITIGQKAQGWMRYATALGLYTGASFGDVVLMRWSGFSSVVVGNRRIDLGVNLQDGVIRYIRRKTRNAGKRVITVDIHPHLAALLQNLRSTVDGEWLFPIEKKLYERNPAALSKLYMTFLRDACGIQTTEDKGGVHRRRRVTRVGFHSLRHSFVTFLKENRIPDHAILQLVGHSNLITNEVYNHDEVNRKQAIAVLPTIDFTSVAKKNEQPAAGN